MIYDLAIQNGTCYIGDGKPGFRANIAVNNNKIAAISVDNFKAERVIDATGLVVCPGFIDAHSHSDLCMLAEPDVTHKIMQGVTTEVIGQDGFTLAPLPGDKATRTQWQKFLSSIEGRYDNIAWDWTTVSEYFKRINDARPVPKFVWLAPTGNIRMCAMGLDARPALSEDINSMKDLLESCIASGAAGLSTGLIYPPSSYMSTEELIELCKVIAKYNLPFVVHQRSEADDILNSMDELLTICRAAGCPLHISHFKVCGKKNARLFDKLMAKLDAMSRELKLTFDQYPYSYGSTTFSAILPPWAHDGGADKCIARLRDPNERARMKHDIKNGIPDHPEWDNFVDFNGPENIFVTSIKNPDGPNKDLVGKNMLEIGELRKCDYLDAAFDLLAQEELGVGLVDFYGLDEHVETILRNSRGCICSDGLMGGRPHPRLYGGFARLLGHYVREKKVLSLSEAIRKMTLAATDVYHIKNIGLLREGYIADITVFDPETIAEKGTFTEPCQFPVGIKYVIANGQVVVDGSKIIPRDERKVLTNNDVDIKYVLAPEK